MLNIFQNINLEKPHQFTFIKTYFDYLYTGLRGDNNKYFDQFCILRDSISPNDSIELIETFLSGTADIFYKNNEQHYRCYNFSNKSTYWTIGGALALKTVKIKLASCMRSGMPC